MLVKTNVRAGDTRGDNLEEMMRITVELGGTITGEHGVGYAKREFIAFEQRPELIALQRSIKAVFDPWGLFNPGKIFPPEKIS